METVIASRVQQHEHSACPGAGTLQHAADRNTQQPYQPGQSSQGLGLDVI